MKISQVHCLHRAPLNARQVPLNMAAMAGGRLLSVCPCCCRCSVCLAEERPTANKCPEGKMKTVLEVELNIACMHGMKIEVEQIRLHLFDQRIRCDVRSALIVVREDEQIASADLVLIRDDEIGIELASSVHHLHQREEPKRSAQT